MNIYIYIYNLQNCFDFQFNIYLIYFYLNNLILLNNDTYNFDSMGFVYKFVVSTDLSMVLH